MKNRNLSHKDDWATPPYFYRKLHESYNFDFDPCPWHHDVGKWDGLEIEWGERNFINPPYSRKLKESFIRKAIYESKKGKLCVMLLPVSTSTNIFHEEIKPNAFDIDFVRGRIPFIGINAKGQYVNFHLLQDVDWDEKITIPTNDIRNPYKEIPKYVKNSGQHDSMIVVFY